MRNFQGIIFICIRTYSEIFKSALVFLWFQGGRSKLIRLNPLNITSEIWSRSLNLKVKYYLELNVNHRFSGNNSVRKVVQFTAWTLSKYGVFSGPYFPAFGLNTERLSLFSPNAGKWGPGKTPYLDTFHAVVVRKPSVDAKHSFFLVIRGYDTSHF